MNVLITGLGGFVASHLVDFLLEKTDHNIYGTMRWTDSLDNLTGVVDRINRKDRVFVLYADLNDAESMNKAIKDSKPSMVFHLAAQSYPKTSFIAPSETIQTNVTGTLNLLNAVRDFAPFAKVHVCSSSEVYGKVPQDKIPITEDCPFHPASPYAISKVGTDLLGQHYAKAYDMTVMVTRMFTHTGPRRGDVFAESSFAKQIALIEYGKIEPVVQVGNLMSRRTIADVRDAVAAYYDLLTIDPKPGEVYNIGGVHTCTVGDVLNSLFDVSGHCYETVEDKERLRPIDADNQVPDCTKFHNHTGWKAEIPFKKTMEDLLEYWRDRVKTVPVLQR